MHFWSAFSCTRWMSYFRWSPSRIRRTRAPVAAFQHRSSGNTEPYVIPLTNDRQDSARCPSGLRTAGGLREDGSKQAMGDLAKIRKASASSGLNGTERPPRLMKGPQAGHCGWLHNAPSMLWSHPWRRLGERLGMLVTAVWWTKPM